MSEFYISNLLSDKPKSLSNKSEKCFDFLDSLKIEYEYIEYDLPKMLEDKKRIDEAIGVRGIKNLVFRTLSKTNPKYFFIVLYRDTRFDTHAFRDKYGFAKIELVKNDELENLLDTHSGAVSIIELINDKECKLNLYIDEKIFNEKYFRFHPNYDKMAVRIKMEDFKNKLLPKVAHEVKCL